MIDLDSDDLTCLISILQANLPPGKVFAFGSRVSGRDHHVYSDLDLLLDLSESPSPAILSELQEALSQSSLPISVDFIDLDTLSAGFRDLVLSAPKELVTVSKVETEEQIDFHTGQTLNVSGLSAGNEIFWMFLHLISRISILFVSFRVLIICEKPVLCR